MNPEIELDGKIGGGSVIRVGIPLCLALGKSLHVVDVRHNRKRRGLQDQHLAGLQLLQKITNASYIGDHSGSVDLFVGTYSFSPVHLPSIDIPSAGAVSLVFQSLSNYCFASRLPAGFEFNGGGSHVQFSPNFDVLSHVNAPLFEKFGLRVAIQLDKPGFFPSGGAKGKFLLQPVEFDRVNLEEGEMTELLIIAVASQELRKDQIAELMIKGFKEKSRPTSEFAGYAPSDSRGGALSAVLKYDTGIGKAIARVYQGSRDPVEIGRSTSNAAKKIAYNGCAVDEQLADQLIVPLAFAPSGSSYTFDKMYPHVNTNIEVVQQILGDIFEIEEQQDLITITRK